jgi:hypothetical protein
MTNYDELGIRFDLEEVAKQSGDNRSDKVTFARKAPIVIVTDVTKFRESFGDETILAVFDGTSIRVKSQAIARRMLAKGANDEAIREANVNMLRGVRNATRGGTTVVTKYALPNGQTYSGTNETEYQAEYLAALVDAGVPAEIARTIAVAQKLA